MSTITESLAEIKTILKRIEKKREFVMQYLIRQEAMKDPLEKEGGSEKLVASELQAIADLEDRIVELRSGIQTANEMNTIEIEDLTMSISDWLIWRREVAPKKDAFLHKMRLHLTQIRDNGRKAGFTMTATSEKQADIVVNINEKDLAKEAEKLSNILGQLDGQLSLKNATILLD